MVCTPVRTLLCQQGSWRPTQIPPGGRRPHWCTHLPAQGTLYGRRTDLHSHQPIKVLWVRVSFHKAPVHGGPLFGEWLTALSLARQGPLSWRRCLQGCHQPTKVPQAVEGVMDAPVGCWGHLCVEEGQPRLTSPAEVIGFYNAYLTWIYLAIWNF